MSLSRVGAPFDHKYLPAKVSDIIIVVWFSSFLDHAITGNSYTRFTNIRNKKEDRTMLFYLITGSGGSSKIQAVIK